MTTFGTPDGAWALGPLYDAIVRGNAAQIAQYLNVSNGRSSIPDGPNASIYTPIEAVLHSLHQIGATLYGTTTARLRGRTDSELQLNSAVLVEVVHMLLRSGATVDLGPNRNLLELAAGTWLGGVAEVLIKHGADVNPVKTIPPNQEYVGEGWDYIVGRGPLLVAADFRAHEVIRVLLAHGADMEARDSVGYTPLLVAASARDLIGVELLGDAGANLDATNLRGHGVLDLVKDPEVRKRMELLLHTLRVNRPSGVVEDTFRPDTLTHRTAAGHLVRSKSEVIIADALYYLEVPYTYEKAIRGVDGSLVLPDFAISRNDLVIVWEHTGMFGNSRYKTRWMEKLKWYYENGYQLNRTLFITSDDERGSIDSSEIKRIAFRIRELCQSEK